MSFRCPRGHPLSGDGAPGDPCPACLLGLGLAMEAFDAGVADAPASAGVADDLGTIGRYRLVEVVGRGATGVVYRAWDPELRRHVALKTLHPQFQSADFARERERFRREASMIARIEHPRIVPLYDHGEIDGTPWMVQRLFSEGDLSRALQKPVAPDDAARWVMGLADAVAEAHAQGVLHRDIKPSNVFLDEKGDVFLGDFGLACTTTPSTDSFTLTGQAMGSPGYMAPEQARGDAEATGPAADIHGLGALLYHALTGFAPYTGSSLGAVLRRVAEDDVVPVRRMNPVVPADLEAICMKCLEKDPARRYPNALALRDDLGRFLRGEATWARPLSAAGWAWRWCRRRPAISGLAASLVAALIAGLAGTSTAVVRMRSADASRIQKRDELAFEMFSRWSNEHALRRGLDDMASILRESPGHVAAVRRAWSALDERRLPLPRRIFDVPNCRAAAFDDSGDHVVFLTSDFQLAWVDARDGRVLGQHAISNAPPLIALGLNPRGDHAWVSRVGDIMEGWSLPDWKTMDRGVPREWSRAPPPLPDSMRDLGSAWHGFTADGRHVALAFGEGNRAFLELRESPSGRLIYQSKPGQHLVDGADPFPPRGRPPRLLEWAGEAVNVRDVGGGGMSCERVALGKPIEFACWHPQGDRLLLVPLNGWPVLFDIPTSQRPEPRWRLKGEINVLDYSPDGRFIVLGALGGARHLLHADTWTEVQPRSALLATNRWAAWTHHGLLTVDALGQASVVVPGQPEPLAASKASGMLSALAMSPNRQRVATVTAEGLLELWDVSRLPGRRLASNTLPDELHWNWATPRNPFTTFTFHSKATHLAMTWQDGQALAWKVPGLQPASLVGSGFPTTAAAFHPTRQYFVAAEQVGKVWGWDLTGTTTGQPVQLAHHPFVGHVAFDASGRHLITAGIGGRAEIRRWPQPLSEVGIAVTGGGVWGVFPAPNDPACLFLFQDGHVELRGIPDGLLHASWTLPSTGKPNRAAWSPDGGRMLVGTTNGDVFELRIPAPREPVPDWFVEGMEALGQRSVEQDPFGPRSMAHRIVEWRRRLAALNGDGFWASWGRSMGLPR